jgi:hypothetical protein
MLASGFVAMNALPFNRSTGLGRPSADAAEATWRVYRGRSRPRRPPRPLRIRGTGGLAVTGASVLAVELAGLVVFAVGVAAVVAARRRNT